MNSTSISGISTGVALIIQAFAEGSQRFQTWRKGREGKKAVGQEEFATSLHEGVVSVEAKLNSLSLKHGSRFDNGDTQSLQSIVQIRTDFRKAVIDVLINSMAQKGEKDILIDPIALRITSEATRKNTLQAMDELSQRLEAEAAVARQAEFKNTDAEDILPPMPLRETPNLSQTSFADPHAPIPRSVNQHIPLPIPTWNPPTSDRGEDLSSSQAMIPRKSSTSAFFRMFSPKPRPYYLVTPHPPSPAVVPSYKCTEDPADILKEGSESVARLWAAANGSLDNPRGEEFQLYRHSAPLPQLPWDIPMPDVRRSGTPPLYTRDMTPPLPEVTTPPIPGPTPYETGRPSVQSGKRIRSEPVFTFSNPPSRFKRNISGPADPG